VNRQKIFWTKFIVLRFYLWRGYVLKLYDFIKLYRVWCGDFKVKYYEMALKKFNELKDKKGEGHDIR